MRRKVSLMVQGVTRFSVVLGLGLGMLVKVRISYIDPSLCLILAIRNAKF